MVLLNDFSTTLSESYSKSLIPKDTKTIERKFTGKSGARLVTIIFNDFSDSLFINADDR